MASKHCNTSGRNVEIKVVWGAMLKNKPYLVTFHMNILVSLWTFQLTLIYIYIYIYMMCDQKVLRMRLEFFLSKKKKFERMCVHSQATYIIKWWCLHWCLDKLVPILNILWSAVLGKTQSSIIHIHQTITI